MCVCVCVYRAHISNTSYSLLLVNVIVLVSIKKDNSNVTAADNTAIKVVKSLDCF